MSSGSISHAFSDETPQAKALWFQSLTIEERMEMLCTFTDFILAVNPHIADQRDAESTATRICVLAEA